MTFSSGFSSPEAVEDAAWTQHFQQSAPSCTGTSVIPSYLPSWRAEERKMLVPTLQSLATEVHQRVTRETLLFREPRSSRDWAELLAVEWALGGPAWSKSFHAHFLSFNRWSTPRGINEYIWKIKFMLEKKRTKTFFSIFDLYIALHVTIYNYAWSISLLENYFLLKTNCFYIENF